MTNALVYRIPVSTGKLAGLSMPPEDFQWARLRHHGFTHVICLCRTGPERDFTPVRLLYHYELEDIRGSQTPHSPVTEQLHFWRAAYHAWAALRVGRGVAVYCDEGTRRTGAVLAATLRLRGLPTERAVALVDEQVKSVGGKNWPFTDWHLYQISHPPIELLKHTSLTSP